ncbi:MAG: UbiD family decarboxylase, partial [Chloroflexi bacterium]|nr:UbiD family decarboxylase [Chloroflexota bacterium]
MDESQRDLRAWLERVEEMGEVRHVDGAHWKHELGAIADIAREQAKVPLLLFDSIADYPRGRRLISNPFHSLKRVLLTLGLPLDMTQGETAALWRRRRKQIAP